MKIRQGFVSNSSSSSFIVAAKSEEDLKCSMVIKINLADYLSRYIDTITNEAELLEYFKDVLYDMRDEEIEQNKDYKRYLEQIKEGKKLFFLSCSNSGDVLEQTLSYNGLEGILEDKVIIIEGEGGY